MAVSRQGEIIVTDYDNHRAQIFDNNGVFKKEFGRGTAEPGLYNPWNLCIDYQSGNIIICDTGHSKVKTFDSKGNFLRACGVLGQIMEVVAMPYISASKDLGLSAAQLLATIFIIAPDGSQTKSNILSLLSTSSPSSIQLTQSILSQFQKSSKILWKSAPINFQQLLSKFVTTRISGQQAKVAVNC